MKKFHIFILLAVVVGIVFFVTKKSQSENDQPPIVPTTNQYFWSKTCPHCSNVAEFIDSWDKKDKFQMEKYEINESSENRLKFYNGGMFCKISRNELGVPFLVTPNGKCLVGDQPIIEYLKNLELWIKRQ